MPVIDGPVNSPDSARLVITADCAEFVGADTVERGDVTVLSASLEISDQLESIASQYAGTILLVYLDAELSCASAIVRGEAATDWAPRWLSVSAELLAFRIRYLSRCHIIGCHKLTQSTGLADVGGFQLPEFASVALSNLTAPPALAIHLANSFTFEHNAVAEMGRTLSLSSVAESNMAMLPGAEDPQDVTPLWTHYLALSAECDRLKSALEQIKSVKAAPSENSAPKADYEATRVAELQLQLDIANLQLAQLQEELDIALQEWQHLAQPNEQHGVVTTASTVSHVRRLMAWASHNRVPKPALLSFARWTSRREQEIKAWIVLVRSSELLNEPRYFQLYPDARGASLDAAEYYVRFGAAAGHNPGEDFDTVSYLESNPDVMASGMNPLVHYLQYGRDEGRATR